MFIIVIGTDISSVAEVKSIKQEFEAVHEIESWSVDLTDWQKVLRVVSTADISKDLTQLLHQLHINSYLMSVFPTHYNGA